MLRLIYFWSGENVGVTTRNTVGKNKGKTCQIKTHFIILLKGLLRSNGDRVQQKLQYKREILKITRLLRIDSCQHSPILLKNNLNIFSGPYWRMAALVLMPLWTTCYIPLFGWQWFTSGDWINRSVSINTHPSSDEFYHLTNLWGFLQSHKSNVNQVLVQMSSQVFQEYLNTLDNITNILIDSTKMEREEAYFQRSQDCYCLKINDLFSLHGEP